VVFDLAGRRVRTLLDHASLVAGPHEVRLATSDLRAGFYLARLEVGRDAVSRKLLVIR
jgi:hypothetical protein